jgi:hypothetical protein
MKINQIIVENYDGEYDDEAGMAQTNLHTIARAAQGLLDTIDDQENLPEWVQEKIAKVEGMMVTAWDYLRSQEEQGIDPRMMEAANAAQQAAIAISMKKAGKKPKSQVNELAPDAGGGGSGNYFQALASAWYNHDISMLADIARKGGSPMKKITDAQEAVEKMLQRGVIGSDGTTRKYDITYNSDFDGVVIQSKDYYEYSDYDAAGNEVDSRNGRPWGPNDYMEFGDNDLDESMYEASPELTEEFDLIESIIERLAEHNGVDAEVIWEDLETLTEDELYAFAVTSEPIMEYGNTKKGQKMLTRVQKRAVDRTIKADDKRDPKAAKKNADTADSAWERMTDKDLDEDWQKANKRDKTDGMSQKAVNAYRRENPGSKLKTAVTTKPSKLKKGGKASKRRKSYCSRSRGQMKMHSISCAKTPDKAICKARRRWNC